MGFVRAVARVASYALVGLIVPIGDAGAANDTPEPLEFRIIALDGPNGVRLAVMDGQVVLANSPSPWTEWTFQETDRGWTIRSRPSRDQTERWFLGVDEHGAVVLVEAPNQGAYWRLTRRGERPHDVEATLRATAGKFDGWYLGFAEESRRVERGRGRCEAYRPVLLEKPGERRNLRIYIDGP